MKSTYADWARFDVDAELARVDEREAQEQRARAELRRAQAKRGVEDAAAQSSGDAAEILAAQAAVAALKARRGGRQASRGGKAAERGESGARGEAERLEAQAELLRRKHALLQTVMGARRDGESLLDGGSEAREALECFERALGGVKTLEQMLPEMLEATEKEQQVLNRAQEGGDGPEHHDCSGGNKGEEYQEHQHDHDHAHDHAHDGECQHGCSSKQQKADAPKQNVLPKPSDLKAVIEMFYKDVYMGIGMCHTRSRRLAAASEAYKEVLLRDPEHAQAWMARGKAFEEMGNVCICDWLRTMYFQIHHRVSVQTHLY